MRGRPRIFALCLVVCLAPCLQTRAAAQAPPVTWDLLDELPFDGTSPRVLAGFADTILHATGQRLELLDPLTLTPTRPAVILPFRVGLETKLAVDGHDCYLLPGSGATRVLRVNALDSSIEKLPRLPLTTLSRAVIDAHRGNVYVACEGVPWTVFQLTVGAHSWRRLTGTGRAPAGLWARGIFSFDQDVVLWPDHHSVGFKLDENRWAGPADFGVLNFRAFRNGGMLEPHRGQGSAYMTQGNGSHLLLEYLPAAGKSFVLRPRLPLPLRTPTDGLFLVTVNGVPHLHVYFDNPHNRLARIPTSALQRITDASPQSDLDSPWRNHLPNGFRLYRTPDARGCMGALPIWPFGDVVYTFRRGWMRAFIRFGGRWLRVRDLPLKENLLVGGRYPRMNAQVNDGVGYVYYLSGNGEDFLRIDPVAAHITRLPHPPMEGDRIMAMALLDGHPWLVARNASGQGSLTLMEFVIKSGSWRIETTIPDDSHEDSYLGLFVHERRLFLLREQSLDEYDPETGAIVAKQPVKPTMPADGGMAAKEGANVFLIGAGGRRNLARLDLATRRITPVETRLPNVVSVCGNRAVFASLEGERVLLVSGGHDSNELWSIDKGELLRR